MVVLCQKREAVAAWLETRPVPFAILADEDRANARRWGVYVRLNFESIHIARPASFVVDRRGIVRYAHVSRLQTDVPAIDEVVGVIRAASD